MGGIESSGESREWFADKIRRVGKGSGMEAFEAIEKEAGEVIFFEDVHGPMFRELWEGEHEIRFVGLLHGHDKSRLFWEWEYGGHRLARETGEGACSGKTACDA